MRFLHRCFPKLSKIMADILECGHLIYSGKLGEIGNPVAWRELHNIIPSWVWTLICANLAFGFQTKLALHQGSYFVDQIISIHASNLLSWLTLDLSLRALYLKLLTLSLRLLSLNLRLMPLNLKLLKLLCIIIIRIMVCRMWLKLICVGIRNQMITL